MSDMELFLFKMDCKIIVELFLFYGNITIYNNSESQVQLGDDGLILGFLWVLEICDYYRGTWIEQQKVFHLIACILEMSIYVQRIPHAWHPYKNRHLPVRRRQTNTTVDVVEYQSDRWLMTPTTVPMEATPHNSRKHKKQLTAPIQQNNPKAAIQSTRDCVFAVVEPERIK